MHGVHRADDGLRAMERPDFARAEGAIITHGMGSAGALLASCIPVEPLQKRDLHVGRLNEFVLGHAVIESVPPRTRGAACDFLYGS